MLEILQILVHKSYTLRLFSLFTKALVILIIMSIYKLSLVKSLKLLSIIFLQTKINYRLTWYIINVISIVGSQIVAQTQKE